MIHTLYIPPAFGIEEDSGRTAMEYSYFIHLEQKNHLLQQAPCWSKFRKMLIA